MHSNRPRRADSRSRRLPRSVRRLRLRKSRSRPGTRCTSRRLHRCRFRSSNLADTSSDSRHRCTRRLRKLHSRRSNPIRSPCCTTPGRRTWSGRTSRRRSNHRSRARNLPSFRAHRTRRSRKRQGNPVRTSRCPPPACRPRLRKNPSNRTGTYRCFPGTSRRRRRSSLDSRPST
jgi:hypothetical protein